METYTVEILNLGRRPVEGVGSRTDAFTDLAAAMRAMHEAIGELAMHPELTLMDAGHREAVGRDGVLAAARLSHAGDGARVEVLLRRRLPDGDDDA